MKLVVARSMTLCRGIFGLKPKSKSSKVLLPSKFALRRRGRLLAVAAFDLVVQEPVQKFLEGESIVDGLAAAQIEGLEDAGQAQLFEDGDEIFSGVHRCLPGEPRAAP